MAFHPHPLVFLVLGLVAGTLAPLSEPSPPLVLALGLAGLLATLAMLRPANVPLAALIAAAAAVGAALGADARATYEEDALPSEIARVAGPIILHGRAVTDAEMIDDEMRFDVETARIVADGLPRAYSGRVRVFVRGLETGPFRPVRRVNKADEIRAWVDLRRPEPVRSPGGFDQFEWARREGIHAFATCKNERLLQVTARRPSSRALLDLARDRLKSSWRHVADPLDRAVTASMVLGDEGALDMSTREEFRSAGLLHLLVVSGSQVAALILGIRRVMPRALRIAWLGCLIECAALLTYCLLAGAGDSIVRATVMAVAFAVAVRVDLTRAGSNFLFAAAIVLLALRPLDARDPGAQMSFTVALALVLFAGALTRALEAKPFPSLLADVVSATLVASIAVAPLTLFHFHRFSLIALPANLVAAPLAVLLLYGSLATAVLDVFVPKAAVGGGAVCGLIAEALRGIAHHAAQADPDWRGPAPPLALIAGLAGLALCRGWRRWVIAAASLTAALALSGRPSGDGRLHVWFLDVGQGDAILIETPKGRVAAIDAGPAFGRFDAGERVVAEALWELGHRRLDFLAISHRHADHEGGAPFLARHFDPQNLYVNGDSALLRGLRTTRVARGASWNLDGVDFRLLGPDPEWPLPGHDENGRSLVVEVRYGATRFLLMGDAGSRTESLLDLEGRPYDLVKAGHHGAVTSSTDGFVRQTRPRIAVISVGSRNRFGHPASKVVERWTSGGALLWRTDRDRTLHVISDGQRLTW